MYLCDFARRLDPNKTEKKHKKNSAPVQHFVDTKKNTKHHPFYACEHKQHVYHRNLRLLRMIWPFLCLCFIDLTFVNIFELSFFFLGRESHAIRFDFYCCCCCYCWFLSPLYFSTCIHVLFSHVYVYIFSVRTSIMSTHGV